jgi:hypothetical protein
MFDRKAYNKQYYKENKEKISSQVKKYQENNNEKIIKTQKEYHKNNKEKIAKHMKEYYQKNKDKYPEWSKESYYNHREERCKKNKQRYEKNKEGRGKQIIQWAKNNPDKIKMIKKKCYEKNKIKLDFKINNNIRGAIWRFLKGDKNGRHWEILVGYTLDKLKKHLEKTMPKGHTWEDYINGKLHIDHIIPVTAFNFSKPEHIDFKRCWSLNNLRLLPADENIRKNNKLEKPFQPALKF